MVPYNAAVRCSLQCSVLWKQSEKSKYNWAINAVQFKTITNYDLSKSFSKLNIFKSRKIIVYFFSRKRSKSRSPFKKEKSPIR